MEKKETFKQTILPSAIYALAHSGYTYTSAVMDIIDNSAEKYVNASKISLSSELKDGKIERIIIADDGIGMDKDTLVRAIHIGSDSNTVKSADTTLGVYGMGLKTAAASLGYKLEVYTRQRGSDKLLYGYWNIPKDRIPKTFGEASIVELKDDGVESVVHKYAQSDFGTVVIISDLRSIKNVRPYDFSRNMSRNVGIHFNKFIKGGSIKFYVNKRIVPYVDPIGDTIGQDVTLMGEGYLTVGEKKIRYKAWNIASFIDDENESSDTNFIPRTLSNQGIYIYRMNRLVGNALTLGLFSRRTSINGFRVELFMDGTCDDLFSSDYTKIISEKRKEDINPELYEQLKDKLSEYWIRVEKEYKHEMSKKREQDPLIQDFLDSVRDSMNNNDNLNIVFQQKKREKKEERETKKREKSEQQNKDEKEPKEPQQKKDNPNPDESLYEPSKKRNRWIQEIHLKNLGTSALFDIVNGGSSSVVIYINEGHPYFNRIIDVLRKQDTNKGIAGLLVASMITAELVRRDLGYYANPDSDIMLFTDRYERASSRQIYDALKGNED